MAGRADKVVLKVEISYEDYLVLEREARRKGYALVSDYVRDVIVSHAREGDTGAGPSVVPAIESMAKRLERTIVDLINPFTGKIDELAQRIADLSEKLEKAETAEERTEPIAEERGRRRGFTAVDRLRSEGVVFEEDLRWLKAPEKFFQRLEREGAIVINLGGERVAIDKSFWEKFVSEVEDIKARDPDHALVLVEEKLGGKAARLFEKLVRASIAFYDEDLGHWSVPLPGG